MEVEALVAEGQTREAWSKIQRWYQQVKVHLSPPTREGLDHTSTLKEELYMRHLMEGESIPILVQPAETIDGPPVKEGYTIGSAGTTYGGGGSWGSVYCLCRLH